MAGTLKLVLYGVLALILVADVVIPPEHSYFYWDGIPGFNAFYGFSAAVIIIVVAEFLAEAGIKQDEDFYE